MDRVPNVLICDDSPVERGALALFLRRSGYGVEEAEDGNAALSILKNQQIDMLVLDLNMPQRDGFGVLSYIHEHRRALPVILMSGMSPDEIQEKMHHMPTPELPTLFIKPIDPERLLDVMEMHLSGQFPSLNAAEPASPDGVPDRINP